MALRQLILRDFVIVHKLELDFSGGFTALTGETGAGKSILIDAIQMALGERASTTVIRDGAARAEVALVFDNSPTIDTWLDNAGFSKEDELLLKRSVDTAGKSRAWINGSVATATQLRELADYLIDIHGQHAWAMLTRASAVRALLDAYGNVDSSELTQAWDAWQQALARLEAAQSTASSQSEERERLNWQIGELNKLSPEADEWTAINTEHSKLANAQSLIDAAQNAASLLAGDDSDADTHAANRVDAAISVLETQIDVEPEFKASIEELQHAQALVQDTAHALHAYLRKLELDPARLTFLDERMGQWLSLARRFKTPPEALHTSWQNWQARLLQLNELSDIDGLQATADKAFKAYSAAAQTVSGLRAIAAPKLCSAITIAMQDLGMNGGRFEVALEACEPSAHGMEDVQFLVAGHAGATPKPVGKVASGGELSRIALSIAVTTSKLGAAPTLIFDEIDAGIGGTTAHTVGRLMQQLGVDRQVLAVTHLAQVAAKAHTQGVVSKTTAQGMTTSQIEWVSSDARVNEIARMLGGETSDSLATAHAREMLGV